MLFTSFKIRTQTKTPETGRTSEKNQNDFGLNKILIFNTALLFQAFFVVWPSPSRLIIISKNFISLFPKAFRLKQMTYEEIGKLLKSLKSFQLNEMEVEKCKKQLVNLVALLNKLEEVIERSEMSAIDNDLDLLNHKLNAILYDGDADEDNFDQSMVDLDRRHDEAALYLGDILLRCYSCDVPKHGHRQESQAREQTRAMLNSQEFIMNFVHEIVWPEMFKRLDKKQKRKQLMVDLKNLTSEEAEMVEAVGKAVVESILGNADSFRSK